MQQTLAIFKPDCIQNKALGQVLARIEAADFHIKALRMMRLTKPMARTFYFIHKGKPFYDDLVSFMIEGPVVVAVLEKEDAVQAWRSLMGATDPSKAEPGTIRRDFGSSVSRNTVHGSDSAENARREIDFFFSRWEWAAEGYE
ncbi:nucleoside-diphosphate kinase [bacterium]|nr:nucleoside-diphosphate kinase [bacterium]